MRWGIKRIFASAIVRLELNTILDIPWPLWGWIVIELMIWWCSRHSINPIFWRELFIIRGALEDFYCIRCHLKKKLSSREDNLLFWNFTTGCRHAYLFKFRYLQNRFWLCSSSDCISNSESRTITSYLLNLLNETDVPALLVITRSFSW
jgi:hypothetical protein